MQQFNVQLLGEFAVHDGDRPVELPPACQRLVALLALKRRPVHRLWVCATLWPHAQTRRAVASLRSAMWRLRPAGAEPLLLIDPQYLQLSPDVAVDWHDAVDGIERLLRGDLDPDLVAELLPLLGAGELLDKWVESWVAQERTRYHDMRSRAFEALGHGADKQVVHSVCGPLRRSHPDRAAQPRRP
ncbi:AfsR/SARP family transcriptional regulator [Mycobacterium deserti]|uniref:Transcriptional regulator n=1 Tax=Mycobacterium deserti TaxID=2978347 RepID=A0ABT2MGA2_9MYCO|nr:transcriptional regulator [Mycobacterium deserti]MCT7660549.1 transcriptional regulator [Mycobacterium deserti]